MHKKTADRLMVRTSKLPVSADTCTLTSVDSNQLYSNAEAFLGRVRMLAEEGDSRRLVAAVFEGLSHARSSLTEDNWRSFAATVRSSAELRLAYSCPFTRHASERPYGYPGDATLIDHIYGLVKPQLTGTATAIYGYTTNSPASRAVRFRRALLAQLIDESVHRRRDARVFAVACGHLRELLLSVGAVYMLPGHFTGLDQDARSLETAVAGNSEVRLVLSAMHRNVRDVIVGRVDLPPQDLVYSAGLYDYLSDDVARRLTASLFKMLAPGGKLMVANFLPHITDVGYMEAVMDWWLTYRDEAQMLSLSAALPINQIARVRQYRDPDENITFLEIVRK